MAKSNYAKLNQGKLNMVKMCVTSFQILFVKYIYIYIGNHNLF